jgi:hypothetical protein
MPSATLPRLATPMGCDGLRSSSSTIIPPPPQRSPARAADIAIVGPEPGSPPTRYRVSPPNAPTIASNRNSTGAALMTTSNTARATSNVVRSRRTSPRPASGLGTAKSGRSVASNAPVPTPRGKPRRSTPPRSGAILDCLSSIPIPQANAPIAMGKAERGNVRTRVDSSAFSNTRAQRRSAPENHRQENRMRSAAATRRPMPATLVVLRDYAVNETANLVTCQVTGRRPHDSCSDGHRPSPRVHRRPLRSRNVPGTWSMPLSPDAQGHHLRSRGCATR